MATDDFSTGTDLLSRTQESDHGHLEYKYKLTDLTPQQIDRLVSQMKYRLNSDEDYGQAVYDIGVTDDGFGLGLNDTEMTESLKNLEIIVLKAGAKICDVVRKTVNFTAQSEEDLLNRFLVDTHSRRKRVENVTIQDTDNSAELKRQSAAAVNVSAHGGIQITRHVAEVLIRKISEQGYIDLRIATAGNVDSGKSSILGVLTHGMLDDGRGRARLSVFHHKHEIDTGRTSTIGQQIMGFNDHGEVVSDVTSIKNFTWEDIVRDSTKIITFFDLAGHEKYRKTTISGMTSNRPDYTMIMVGANMGFIGTTEEHISLCLSMRVPYIVVVTKIDLAPDPVRRATIENVLQHIRKKARKIPYKVNNIDDAVLCAGKISSGDIVPVFQVSNVSGVGLDILKKFLNFLPPRKSFVDVRSDPARFQIQETFRVGGVGTVVAGMLFYGTVRVNDVMKLGPFSTGEFVDVKIRSIECKRVPVEEVSAGRYVCFSLPGIERNRINKGMYLIDPVINPVAHWEFVASIYVSTANSASIKVGYQPFCHIGHIRQTCKILDIMELTLGKTHREMIAKEGGDPTKVTSLGAGDSAKVKLRFCFRPELLFGKDKFIFREGCIRGVGMVTEITDTVHEPLSNKLVTRAKKTRASRAQRRKKLCAIEKNDANK